MAAPQYQVTCTTKLPSHHDPHTRIQAIGGPKGDGNYWTLDEDVAIEGIENGKWEFYVMVGAHVVSVIVAEHKGRKYLKTQTDDYAPDNLLNLQDCPR